MELIFINPATVESVGRRRMSSTCAVSGKDAVANDRKNWSPLEKHVVYGRDILVKRDDLVTFGPRINGNKYRKLLHIVNDSSREPIVAFGPYQSNSMAALASLSRIQGRRFVYYSLPVPPDQLHTPVGNLKFALEAGMELRQIEREGNPPFLFDLAEEGCRQLARELVEQLEEYRFTKVKVACSSASGSLAMFMERYFREHAPHISAVAVPCGGDGTWTRKEMEALDKKTGNLDIIPEVLYRRGEFDRYRREEKLRLWEEVAQQGLPIDLLFGAGAWDVMKTRTDFFKDNSFALVYYHCGGLGGDDYHVENYRKILEKSSKT